MIEVVELKIQLRISKKDQSIDFEIPFYTNEEFINGFQFKLECDYSEYLSLYIKHPLFDNIRRIPLTKIHFINFLDNPSVKIIDYQKLEFNKRLDIEIGEDVFGSGLNHSETLKHLQTLIYKGDDPDYGGLNYARNIIEYRNYQGDLYLKPDFNGENKLVLGIFDSEGRRLECFRSDKTLMFYMLMNNIELKIDLSDERFFYNILIDAEKWLSCKENHDKLFSIKHGAININPIPIKIRTVCNKDFIIYNCDNSDSLHVKFKVKRNVLYNFIECGNIVISYPVEKLGSLDTETFMRISDQSFRYSLENSLLVDPSDGSIVIDTTRIYKRMDMKQNRYDLFKSDKPIPSKHPTLVLRKNYETQDHK